MMALPGLDIRQLSKAYLLFRRGVFSTDVYISASDIRAAVTYSDQRSDEELEAMRPFILTPSREESNQTYLEGVYDLQIADEFNGVDVEAEYLADPEEYDPDMYDSRAAYEAAVEEFDNTRRTWEGTMLTYDDYTLIFNTSEGSDGRAALATFFAHMLYDGWMVYFENDDQLDWIAPRGEGN
jgi:hypothetical protein